MTVLFSRNDNIDLIKNKFKKENQLHGVSSYKNLIRCMYRNLEFIIINSDDEREYLESDINIFNTTKLFFKKIIFETHCFHLIIINSFDNKMIYDNMLIASTYEDLYKEIKRISLRYSSKLKKNSFYK